MYDHKYNHGECGQYIAEDVKKNCPNCQFNPVGIFPITESIDLPFPPQKEDLDNLLINEYEIGLQSTSYETTCPECKSIFIIEDGIIRNIVISGKKIKII